jgi:hypothetical protein
VLLAAYQATGGSEAVVIDSPSGSTAFDPVPTEPPASTAIPPVPAPPEPMFQRPASMSPTSDASHRASREMQGDLHREDPFPPVGPDDLSRMASGDDELADMADGEDELSEMASGRDELSAMAGQEGGSFEAEVNAELAGAKVVFDGGKPVIEADLVEVIDLGEGDPEVIEHVPPASAPTASPPTTLSRVESRPTPAERGHTGRNAAPVEVIGQQSAHPPSRVPAAPSWQSIPGGPSTAAPSPRPAWGKLVGTLMAIPFLLIFCLILAVGRGVGGFMLISLVTFGIIIYLLVRAAGLTGRKTTSMPRDDTWNRRP